MAFVKVVTHVHCFCHICKRFSCDHTVLLICHTQGRPVDVLSYFQKDGWAPLPTMIFGIVGTVAGGLALFLPETLGCEMLETVEDAEAFRG